MLKSIFDTSSVSLSMTSLGICIMIALLLGLLIAFIHSKTTKSSKNFIVTLSILPMLVSFIIIMVNGNLGTSVAVLGAFSLIRFRSVAGSSKEIMSIFFAMTVGVAIGMGQILFASIVTIIVCFILFMLDKIKFGFKEQKKLVITIPENLDFTNLFLDIFNKYLDKYSLEKAKTTNMGSMYELTYDVCLKNNINEKEFIDEIRCRNGNLKIILSHSLEGDL